MRFATVVDPATATRDRDPRPATTRRSLTCGYGSSDHACSTVRTTPGAAARFARSAPACSYGSRATNTGSFRGVPLRHLALPRYNPPPCPRGPSPSAAPSAGTRTRCRGSRPTSTAAGPWAAWPAAGRSPSTSPSPPRTRRSSPPRPSNCAAGRRRRRRYGLIARRDGDGRGQGDRTRRPAPRRRRRPPAARSRRVAAASTRSTGPRSSRRFGFLLALFAAAVAGSASVAPGKAPSPRRPRWRWRW